MRTLHHFIRRQRSAIFAFTLLQAFFMTGGAEAVELRQQGHLRAEVESQRLAKSFGIPLDVYEDPPSWLERSQKVVVEEVDEVFDHSRQEVTRWVEKATTLVRRAAGVAGEDSGLSAADVTVSLTQTATSDLASSSAASSSAAPSSVAASSVAASSVAASSVAASSVGASSVGDPVGTSTTHKYIPKRPALAEGEGERSVASSPFTSQAKAGLTAQASDVLPLHSVTRKARTVDASSVPPAQRSNSAFAPASLPSQRSAAQKAAKAIAPEIVALAASLDNAPGKIFRYVHDQIVYDPKWGADSPPVGTLWEGGGTSWDQAWLLQELLIAAGVDARLEWGEVEVPPSLLTNLTGIDDPIRAGDFLSTAGLPVVLLVAGSQVIAARFPHVWVKAHVDYIPNRGATAGTADTWIRMDPSLTTFESADGLRLDQDVPFVLADHLNSGTELSPRQDYDAALLAYAADQSLGISSVDELKTLHTPVAEDFPFVPGTLRAKILSSSGESETLPSTFEQSLEIQLRAEGGGPLLTWNTTASAIYGQRFEVIWAGATASDQAALDLYGGVFAAPPYEVDLRPTLHLGGVEVASGTSIGSAEDAEIQLTMTPPDGVPTVAGWDLFAGEHGVLSLDFGRLPQQVVDGFSQGAAAASDAFEIEGWQLAQASASYLNTLGGDLDHLSALRWHRLLTLGTAIFGVQRGAVSTSPDGTPQTFSKGPLSLDVGAMPLALFPVDGVQISTVPTLEVLGSQGSFQEGEALEAVFGGEHLTGVTFLTRAVREGQMLTLVDATNVDAALAAAEISSDAKSSVRAGIDRGMVAWISENQIESNTFQTTGYILENPTTGSGGYFVTFERRFTPLDGAITFHNPIDLDVITAPTDVIATIDAEGLESWTLSTRPVGEGATQVIATGTGPVDNTLLGQFDPTLLLNGLHDIVLTGQDAAGQPITGKINVVVEGQMKVGNFSLDFTDLRLPLAGLDIEVVRSYDSRDKRLGDFGFGWTLRMSQGKYINNRRPGDGWQVNGGALPCQSAQETSPHLTAVRLSDEESYLFRLRLSSLAPTLGGCFGFASFEFVEGPTQGATLSIVGNDEFFWENGGNRLVDIDSLEVFEPQSVKLETRDGRTFFLDLELGVTRLEDGAGRSVDITPSSITHSGGQGINFIRDSEGRIEKITDPQGGELTYEYDASGDLIRATDPEGASTTFTYSANHYLEDLFSPLGDRMVRTEYDDDGRMVRIIDANGQVVSFDHDIDGRRDVIVDRLGFAQVLEYDERGNIIREIDEVGAVRFSSFDSNDNLLSHTDPLGNVTTFEYNARNDVTKIVDPLGHVLELTYNSQGEPILFKDALGKTTEIQYTAEGRPQQVTDALGSITNFVYAAHGEVESMTDALDRSFTFEYDSSGNVTREVDPLGEITHSSYDGFGNLISESFTRTLPDGGQETLTTGHTYDAAGREIATTFPDGTQTQVSYDDLGRKTSFTDALGLTTIFDYDSKGQLRAIDYPDGTQDSWVYDVEGHLVAQTDRSGRVTSMVYDPVGRPIEVHLPDGSVQRSAYDAAGRLTSITNRLGHATSFVYDAAGRQTQVSDALGNSVHIGYDTLGRVDRITDRKGQTTEYTYDALGRWTKTVFADDSEQSGVYDAMGRLVSTTDPAGRTRTFAYDGYDRLVSITDPLGGVTAYTYDEAGNRTSMTDANGRTTRLEHDSMGRVTARVLPDGTRETMTYSVGGRPASQTDFSGATTTFSYDASGRPLSKQLADGTQISMTFTASGRRASDQTSLGVTTYVYDDLDQLVEKLDPSGDALRYAYDEVGNLTEQVATVGGQDYATSYSYGALDRLQSVTDFDGGISSMGYDANGNLTSLTYANGVQSSLAYDALNRLTEIETEDPAGTLIDSHTYTLGSNHLIQQVEELDGTTREYTYDVLDRLIEERVTSSAGDVLEQRTFTYDAVGNRLSQTFTDAGGSSETSTYTYDARDRLISDGSITRSSDANGNLISDSLGKTYSWDLEDRLTQVTWSDSRQVNFTYDADGNRVRTVTRQADGSTETVQYLVDSSEFLSQVVAESDGSGALQAHYTRGVDLLSMARPATTGRSYFHGDALGSIRRLTNDSGAVTDTYAYSAFGEATAVTGSTINPYRYTGQRLESATELYDLRARWMDPSVGRFISMDPFQGSTLLPISLHRYLYANANPVHFVDPSGQFSAAGVAVAGAAMGIVSTIAVNWVLGRETTLLDIVKAGVAGAILGPLSLAYPIAGAGLAIFGVFASLGLTASVLTDPNASTGQKVGAIAILIASLVGARAGLRYYRQSVKPGVPPPPKPPAPPKPAPKPAPTPKPAPAPTQNTWTNLVRSDRAHHILYGESPTQGGHMWPGNPGKSIFPKDWGPDKILGVISDIATNPKLTWTRQTGPKGSWFTKGGDPAKFKVEGVWEGIPIRVIVEPAGRGIVTGFPF